MRLPGMLLTMTASALLLGACALGKPPAAPALFDLGPPPAQLPRPGPALSLTALSAPAWLDTAGIAYRLDYQDVYRHEVYRDSRWVAAPSALLGERLRQRFAQAAATEGPRLSLRLELEEFGQVFAAPGRSEVRLRVRAWLGEGAGAGVYGSPRVFEIRRPAPRADAAGAVQGLSQASEELAEQLLAWAARP